MIVDNMLSETISLTEAKARLDNSCKKILANKIILAWIMKHSMDEYRDYDVVDIAEHYIEGTPEIASIAVHQDDTVTELITGISTENSSIREGTVTFDIRFVAIHPVSGELYKLIINLEAQNNFHPGYPLTKRGIYYGSRMISAQYGTEFQNMDYDKLKKVYSIWICMKPPVSRQNTITKYCICEQNAVGHVCEERENYDLMTVVMICLGNPETADSTLLKMLDVLFSPTKNAAEKKSILSSEFHIKMTKSIDEEMMQMCNYSEGVWESGIEKGVEKGQLAAILSLMRSMSWTIDQAMAALLIPESQQELYREKIQLPLSEN